MPIALPEIGFTSTRFDPIVTKDVSYMEGRRSEAMVSMTPYWVASYSTPTPHLSHLGEADAFMMDIEAGETFRAFDTTRPRPLDYLKGPLSGARAGGGPFDGTATITSRTVNSVTVSGLPANFQFRVSDYVEVRKSATLLSLHRLRSDVQASVGGVATLPIRMNLDVGVFTLPLVANFEKPAFLAQIDSGSWSISRQKTARGIAFSATEVFFS